MSVSLQKGIEALKRQIDAPIASFFNSCVHCGMCAGSCLFYVATGDPKYTPIHKLEPLRKVWKQEYTFWGRLASKLGLSKSLTDDDLDQWKEAREREMQSMYRSRELADQLGLQMKIGDDVIFLR